MIYYELIRLIILFGCLLINIFAYSPLLAAGRRPPPPSPSSRNQNLPPAQRQTIVGRRPSLTRSYGSSNLRADNRLNVNNPPRQRSEEIPGAYHIGGNRRINVEEEHLVVARMIPQAVAEPVPTNNRIIDRLRLLVGTGATVVERESDDEVGPLAELHDQQERRPLSVRAERIGWF